MISITAFRLFPQPYPKIYTPFTAIADGCCYGRLDATARGPKSVRVRLSDDGSGIVARGCPVARLAGERPPDRQRVLSFCRRTNCNPAFKAFARTTYVLPVFPLSVEEAFVKTVTRQIISARQAKHLLSALITALGPRVDGIYGFPATECLMGGEDTLRSLGFGLKCDVIVRGIRDLAQEGADIVPHLKGVGPWSRQVIEVETKRDYRYYPFWDKSAEAIGVRCGVDIASIYQTKPELASDLYVYCASYLDALRWQSLEH